MINVLKKIKIVLFVVLISLFIGIAVNASEKVNINTAGKEELVTLKYVGEKLAERIIAFRKDHPFQKPEDIILVKGIGEKTYEANKEIIIIKDD